MAKKPCFRPAEQLRDVVSIQMILFVWQYKIEDDSTAVLTKFYRRQDLVSGI